MTTIRKGDRAPPVRKGIHLTLEYEEDHKWVIHRGVELWVKGANVYVSYAGIEYTFWEYLIATRLNDDEPLQVLIEYLRRRRGLRKSYAKVVTLSIIEYAKAIKKRTESVRLRFHRLLYKQVTPGTEWEEDNGSKDHHWYGNKH